MIRRRLNDKSCNLAINTTYNNDHRIEPFRAIMFEVVPKKDLKLLTFELDVSVFPWSTPDLSVEVYTLVGGFEGRDDQRHAWTLVANTTGVLLPYSEGMIIPTSGFEPVQLKKRERRSFYISLKEKILDYNLRASGHIGGVFSSIPEMDIFVGAGYDVSYQFPGLFSRIADPQFAGVMYFQPTDCNQERVVTEVNLDMLLEKELTSDLSFQASVSMEETISQMLASSPSLVGYQNHFGMEKSNSIQTFRRNYQG